MVLSLELVPSVGALPIKLGTTRSFVKQQFLDMQQQIGMSSGSIDYYCNNVIQIEFDSCNQVMFIGIAPSLSVELLYSNQNLLVMSAQAVFDLVAAGEAIRPKTFNTNEHLFLDQIITVWDADKQYDHDNEKIAKWGQIGIGNSEHLAAIAHIIAK